MKLLETGIRLSLPYNHDPGFPEWLAAHRAGVAEVYLPLHGSVVASGRVWRGPAPGEYQARLAELAAVMRAADLTANVAVNVLVLRPQRAAVLGALEGLAALFHRLVVTVTDFDLALELRRALPDVALAVSTLADVDNPMKAAFWRDEVGVGSIAVGRLINKRPAVLREIRALGVALRLVLDDNCAPSCPATLSHMGWIIGGDHDRGAGCAMTHVLARSPWLRAQKDVVPATLPRYDGLIDLAKIAGRELPLAAIAAKVELYLAASSYAHPHHYYVEPPEAFGVISECGRACASCTWCAEHLLPVPAQPAPSGAAPGAPTALALGVVRADGAALLRVALCGAVAGTPEELLEIDTLARMPSPFVKGARLGLCFRGDAGRDPRRLELVREAGRALLALAGGPGESPDELAAAIERAGLTRPHAGRPWSVRLTGRARGAPPSAGRR